VRKSSGRVTLVLMGVATLAGCGDGQRRDVYKTQADCLADWGNTAQDCSPATEPRHQGMGYFYGPSYGYHGSWWGWGHGSSWSSSTRGSRAIGSLSSSHASSSTARGGFGSTAHASSSGG
jgi:hypothetical protein